MLVGWCVCVYLYTHITLARKGRCQLFQYDKELRDVSGYVNMFAGVSETRGTG